MTNKFCINCIHCKNPDDKIPDCSIHAREFIDLVTGKRREIGIIPCEVMRTHEIQCGREGRFFVEKF